MERIMQGFINEGFEAENEKFEESNAVKRHDRSVKNNIDTILFNTISAPKKPTDLSNIKTIDECLEGKEKTSENTAKDSIETKINHTVVKDFASNYANSTTKTNDDSFERSNYILKVKEDLEEIETNCFMTPASITKDVKDDLKYVDLYANDLKTDIKSSILETEDVSSCFELKTTSEEGKVSEEFSYKFVGPVFRSLKEKSGKRWGRSYGEDLKTEQKLKATTPELNRSQYSVVSCGELTAGAVQLWLDLPEEVKYDPSLASFRQLHERENGKDIKQNSKNVTKSRLPLVNSAPHLNNNLHGAEDVAYICKGGTGLLDVTKETKDDVLDNAPTQKKQTKMARARYFTKMTLLLACWVFFTVVFLMYNEKEELVMNSSVAAGEVKNYILHNSDRSMAILVMLSGPFLSETSQSKLNSTELEKSQKMDVWLEKWILKNGDGEVNADDVVEKESAKPWTIVLQNEDKLDFSKGEPRSSTLRLESTDSNQSSVFALRMRTTANQTAPFRLSYTTNPVELSTGVIYACLLLCGLYVLIIFEVINRTLAAVLVSTTALATLALVGERPSLPELISWLDVETLLLLFSMMLLVAIMAETGLFDFLAAYTFEVTKGKLWPLISVLCIITAVLSTVLDNVTTVLLMTPVTIRLCEVMDLNPIPILMSMVLYSNIGGTATPVGDPPNVIIASNKAVTQAGINFTNFTFHMTLGILLVSVQTYIQLRYMFRDSNKLRLNVPRDIQDLRQQIIIWRRAADSLPHLSKDQHIVKERLERKIRKLGVQLQTLVKQTSKRACPKDTFQSTLVELKNKYKIRDKVLLIKASFAISFVVALFFLHSIPELNRVSLGWTALLGAILLLVLADREDLEPILHRVEWSTLLFFAALFVLMEALSKLGLIEFIGNLTETIILKVDESARLAVALLLMLWVSGVTSAFVDNIPLTTMMVRVVTSLGSNPNLNLPMAPLIWALSFGACLGGNGTLIGASANVVCAGVAEQHGYKFSFVEFFKIGFPIMIGHLVVASGYLLLCHCVFTWH